MRHVVTFMAAQRERVSLWVGEIASVVAVCLVNMFTKDIEGQSGTMLEKKFGAAQPKNETAL